MRSKKARGESKGDIEEGVKLMKIAASEAVVPMLSLHKFG
jgi:hypothetical protein